jgi:hypothetical protein
MLGTRYSPGPLRGQRGSRPNCHGPGAPHGDPSACGRTWIPLQCSPVLQGIREVRRFMFWMERCYFTAPLDIAPLMGAFGRRRHNTWTSSGVRLPRQSLLGSLLG